MAEHEDVPQVPIESFLKLGTRARSRSMRHGSQQPITGFVRASEYKANALNSSLELLGCSRERAAGDSACNARPVRTVRSRERRSGSWPANHFRFPGQRRTNLRDQTPIGSRGHADVLAKAPGTMALINHAPRK